MGKSEAKVLGGDVVFTEDMEEGAIAWPVQPWPPLTAALFPQPVVQRAESGPRVHGPGDPGDARRAGEPTECRGV